jgi:fermentation-respiration switch protein FrsA (DUF1100 family)
MSQPRSASPKPARYGFARVWVGAAVLCLGVALVLVACQGFFLYPGTSLGRGGDPQRDGFEVIELETKEGVVEAWLLPRLDGASPGPAALFFHGNYETVANVPPRAQQLRRMGVTVLAVEYPGYGGMPGSPSQESLTAVAVAAYDALAAHSDVDAARIAAWGWSLGGAPAAQLAERRPIKALVLQSTFTSVEDMAWEYGLPSFLVSDPFDTRSVVAKFEGPVLVLHGTRDEVVPYAHAQALVAAREGVELHVMACGHNDCPARSDLYWTRIADFLTRAGVIGRR